MKNLLLLFSLVISSGLISAQASFFDDFESYNVGDYVGEESTQWTTWSGTTGGSEDVQVVDDRSSSGNQSIYFSAGATSGPQDVILDFGDVRTTGEFTFYADFYVESDAGAYFNFQGAASPGEIWTINVTMLGDGTFQVDDASSILITTFYPTDEWFTVRIIAHLDSDVFEIYINDQCIGAVPVEGDVSMLDLFPLAGNSFWVDDVGYDYDPSGGVINTDVGLSNLTFNGAVLTGESGDVEVLISNNGMQDITGVTLGYTVDGGLPILVEINELIVSGESITVTLINITLDETGHFINVEIIDIQGGSGDEIACNNHISLNINPVTPAENKAVVAEEATGTWCQWCPRGAVFMDSMEHLFGDKFVPIAVHNGDPMVLPSYDLWMQLQVGGYPSSIFNRDVEVDPSNLLPLIVEALDDTPAVYMTMGAEYDDETRLLKMSLAADVQMEINSDWEFNFVVTEDSVTGTAPGYAQVNIYAGGAFGDMGPYDEWPNPVPPSLMVYDHVARATANVRGMPNSVPSILSAGATHVLNYEWTVPAGIDVDQLNIIGMLLSPDGSLDNAIGIPIQEAIDNGFILGEENIQLTSFSDVYPNPSNDYFTFSLDWDKASEIHLQVYDLQGKRVDEVKFFHNADNSTVTIHTENWQSGTYILHINTDEGYAFKKVEIIH